MRIISLEVIPVLAFTILTAGSVLAQKNTSNIEEDESVHSSTINSKKAYRSNRLLEEVVVTAQKREENISEVPIAISAYSADMLDAQGVISVDGLARITPGLTFTKTGGFSVIYLRGVGTDAFLPGADQTVPQYVDGVNIVGAQGSQYELGRIERVEVLKGPQGTLFGRNSTGGAINIITPNPGPEFEGDLEIDYGNYQKRNLGTFLNLPITESFGLTASYFNQVHDEYYENLSGPIFDPTYNRGGSSKIRWDIDDNISLTIFGQYAKNKTSDSLVLENTNPSPILGALITPDELDRSAHNNVLGGSITQTHLIAATLDWGFSWFDAKVVVSDQKFKSPFNSLDFDNSELPLVSFVVPKQFAEQSTAELQILSNEDTPWADKFEWVAGLYYLEGLGGFEQIRLQVAKDALPAVLGNTGLTIQDTLNGLLGDLGLPNLLSDNVDAFAGGLIRSKSASAYFQGTYYFTQDLNLTVGARYQKEMRGVREAKFGILDPLDPSNDTEMALLTFDPPDLYKGELAPKVGLQWLFSESGQVYTSWARGFQSPTYNAVNFFSNPDPVDEVQVDTYEIGIKTELFDGALSFDSAIFYTDEKNVTNAFISLTSGGLVRFNNVGAAEIYGIEFSGVATPFPNWNPNLVLTGGATYLHAYYTDFQNGRGIDEDTGLAYGPGSLVPLPGKDFSGNRIVRTPEWTSTVGLSQLINFDSGGLELGVDYYYNSGFYFLAQNTEKYNQGEYGVLNARVSYRYDPWGVRLTAYCLNALDTEYVDSMFPNDFGVGKHLSAPRLYGAKVKWEF